MRKRRITALFLAVVLILPVLFSFSYAEEAPSEEYVIEVSDEDTFNSLQQQYEKLEESINAGKLQLGDIQKDINNNVNYLAVLNSQIDILNAQIKILDNEIANSEKAERIISGILTSTEENIEQLEAEIVEYNRQIAISEKELDAACNDLAAFLRSSYMAGETNTGILVFETIFNSSSIEEYLIKKEVAEQLAKEKTALVSSTSEKYTKLETEKNELATEKMNLERDQQTVLRLEEQREYYLQELENDKFVLNSKKRVITSKKEDIKGIIVTLDENSDVYKDQIKRDREEMEVISTYVDDYVSQYSSALGDIPDVEFSNDGSMQWPVNFDSYISCGYPSYSDGSPHWGIDICASDGMSAGKPFNAAQGGTVVIAMNDDNWNGGFGNYCVIDHGDGTQTLYAHSSGLVVSQGDVVRKGEQIGYIGSTGNTTGPHLHFEVRVKQADGSVKRVNPLNYVSN